MYKVTTFRQLNAIDAVARLGGVSRAAQELHLTQPTVSVQIRLLEEAAGTPLVQRSGRGLELTEAGDVVARYAAQILALWRDAVDEVAGLKGVLAGTLRVGAVITAEYLLPPLLVTFTKDRPEVKIKLSVGNREEVQRMLSKREIDLAIMGRPPSDMQTNARVFAKHPMAFIAASGHALMSRRKCTLQDLQSESLLVRERGSGAYNTVERLFKVQGLRFLASSELSSNEAIKQMVAAGLGIGFLSLHACVLEFEAGQIGVLPLPGNPVEHDWYVLHPVDASLSPVAAAFRAFLVDHGELAVRRQLHTFEGVLRKLGRTRSGGGAVPSA